MSIIDLEEQFSFYAAYHHSTVNKIVHIVCVWPILWSAFVAAEYIPLEFGSGWIHPLNVTFIAAVFYAGVYITMDKKAGSLAAILVFFCLLTARNFYIHGEEWCKMPVWQSALIIHVAGWIAQFIGHGVFEGRSPALFDNLFQAVVMAPLFVLLEVLFMFGYRKDFQKKMWARVEKEIASFKKNKMGSKGKKK